MTDQTGLTIGKPDKIVCILLREYGDMPEEIRSDADAIAWAKEAEPSLYSMFKALAAEIRQVCRSEYSDDK